jgi:hypothetical protein
MKNIFLKIAHPFVWIGLWIYFKITGPVKPPPADRYEMEEAFRKKQLQ